MNAAEDSLTVSQPTRNFLAGEHLLLIGGQRTDAADGQRIEVQNPATEEIIATVSGAGPDDIDRAVAAARKALKGEWSRMTSHDRTRIMLKFADEIDANLELISEVEVLENGLPKTISEYTVARFGADFIRYFAGWATKIHGQTIPVSPGGAAH